MDKIDAEKMNNTAGGNLTGASDMVKAINVIGSEYGDEISEGCISVRYENTKKWWSKTGFVDEFNNRYDALINEGKSSDEALEILKTVSKYGKWWDEEIMKKKGCLGV